MKIVTITLCGRKISLYTGSPSGQRTEICPPSWCSGTQSCPDATSGPSSPDPHYSDRKKHCCPVTDTIAWPAPGVSSQWQTRLSHCLPRESGKPGHQDLYSFAVKRSQLGSCSRKGEGGMVRGVWVVGPDKAMPWEWEDSICAAGTGSSLLHPLAITSPVLRKVARPPPLHNL